MPGHLSKPALVDAIVQLRGVALNKYQVKRVIDALAIIAHRELKKSGVFLVPGLAKFVVVKKAATKERKAINPFTKQPTVYKAKPARNLVKARAVEAIKNTVT